MSVKLYLESVEPFRGIIVFTEDSDLLECKASNASYNYLPQGDKRGGTFSGELRVKDVPFEMIDEKLVKNIKEDLKFTSATQAKEIMDKLHAIVPEEKPTKPDEIKGKMTTPKDILKLVVASGSKAPNGLKEVAPGEYEVDDVEAIVKEAEGIGLIKPNQQKGKGNRNKNRNKHKKITPSNLKSELNNKQAREKAQKEKEAKASERKTDIDPETKRLIDQKNKFGYIPVNMKYYEKGYYLGHAFQDKDGNRSMLMIGHPAPTQDQSRILIFPDLKKAKFTHESLLKHPRHQNLVGQAVPHPISEIPKEQRSILSVLITDPLTYVNGLEKSE